MDDRIRQILASERSKITRKLTKVREDRIQAEDTKKRASVESLLTLVPLLESLDSILEAQLDVLNTAEKAIDAFDNLCCARDGIIEAVENQTKTIGG